MGTRTVDVGSVQLTIAEEGMGGRPLMLVHGFTGAKEDFTDFLAPLAERGGTSSRPTFVVTVRAASPTTRARYTLAVFAGDLFALADSLGWGRFTLLGHSMGGMIAQHMLLGAPDRIEALILMDTAHGPLEGIGDPSRDRANAGTTCGRTASRPSRR